MQAQKGVTSEQNKQQTAFLVAMAALFAVFVVLLLCGDIGGQSDIVYLAGRDFQADAMNTEAYARELDPYGYAAGDAHVPFKDANYPPLAYVIFYLLDVVSGRDMTTVRALAVSVAFSALGVLFVLGGCRRLLYAPRGKRLLLLAAFLVSMPTVYAFERGNIILFAVGLCAWFLLGYRSESALMRELSFLALAAAAALKIFPAMLGLLLLAEKRYRDALRLVLYGLLFAFLPFLLLRGGFDNLRLLLENFGAHTAYYRRLIYPRFGFRLVASLTYDVPWASPFLADQFWKAGDALYAVAPYFDIAASIGCAAFALLASRRWEAALAIMLVLVNYPVNSGAYTALYLLPVIAMYLSCDGLTKRDRWILAAFILLLSPLQLPFPKSLMLPGESILCNLTDILRNFAAYALFIVFGARGIGRMAAHIRSGRAARRQAA